MRPFLLKKSIHCQICNAIIFPLTFSGKGIQDKCKCTKEELKKRKNNFISNIKLFYHFLPHYTTLLISFDSWFIFQFYMKKIKLKW